MREADLYTIERIGIPSLVLMERAALEVVREIEKNVLDSSKILVVCGAGNNGGDGYAVARLLHIKGYQTEIFFLGKEKSRSEENQVQKKITDYYGITTVTELQDEYDLIVDAVFGTGLKRKLEGIYYETIERLNHMKGTKLAIDIPSGIHDELGCVMGVAFQADITVAIAYIKRGAILQPGNLYAGTIVCGDIGITKDAIPTGKPISYGYEISDLKERYPKRGKNTHKGSYGKVLMIVGSKGMSGAAYLSAKAAYAVGAGLVQIFTAEENRIILQQLLPEAIVTTYQTFEPEKILSLLEWADVVGMGSGLGTDEVAEHIVKYVLEEITVPCVLDADALNIIAKNKEWLDSVKSELVITPHMKEMSRLLSCSVAELSENRVERVAEFVKDKQITCVLKDARTIVEKENERIYINVSGNAAMAKGGSGDVLTGIVSGIIGQGVDCYNGACIGTYLHGLSGDFAKHEKSSHSVLASDIISGISGVLKEI